MQVLIMVLKKILGYFLLSLNALCYSHMPLPFKKVHMVIFLNETSNYENSKTTGKLRPPRKRCAEILHHLLCL